MKAILKPVSRSFYLTIRFLPDPLRKPVALAYLLARATDTIADTAEIAADIRLTTLPLLARVIAGELDFGEIAGPLREFAARQSDPHERNLIENLRSSIDQLAAINAADRNDIRDVLRTIVRGQELDLLRFGGGARSESERTPAAAPAMTEGTDAAGCVRSLQRAAELEEYTYLVAGCVGEFWTKLGFRHFPLFGVRPPNEMSRLGIEYGKGLQLINVLRDTGADLEKGRCYLPADELAAAPAAEVFARWLEKAEAQITVGIDYCLALTNWRVRFATALPALIGARTIALLRKAGGSALRQRIKVPRAEVRWILVRAFLAMRSRPALCRLFAALKRR